MLDLDLFSYVDKNYVGNESGTWALIVKLKDFGEKKWAGVSQKM